MSLTYTLSKIIKKTQVSAVKNSNIDRKSKVCSASHLVNSSLGRYSYIGNNCTVVNANIGKFCSVADNCIIGGASHPTGWVSTSPVFYKGNNILKKNFSSNEFISTVKTVIENDVWIGSNVLIKAGVSIGNGSVIGMGSVVTKDIGPYEVWAGNPARMIRKRFDDAKIADLLKIEWWDFTDVDLNEQGYLVSDVDKFIAYNIKRRNQDYEDITLG